MEWASLSQGWDEEDRDTQQVEGLDDDVEVCDSGAHDKNLALEIPPPITPSWSAIQKANIQAGKDLVELCPPQVAWPKHRLRMAQEPVSAFLNQQCAATEISTSERAWRSLGGTARDALEVVWSKRDTDWQERQNWLMYVDMLFEKVEPWRWQRAKLPIDLLLLLLVVSLDGEEKSMEVQELLCFAAEELQAQAATFRADVTHVASLLLFRAALLLVWNGGLASLEQLYDLIEESAAVSSCSKQGLGNGESASKRQRVAESDLTSLVQLGETALRDLAWKLTQEVFQGGIAPSDAAVVQPLVTAIEEVFPAATVRDAVLQLAMGKKEPPAPRPVLQAAETSEPTPPPVLQAPAPAPPPVLQELQCASRPPKQLPPLPPVTEGLEQCEDTGREMLALVINLKRRSDRWESFTERIAAMQPRTFRIEQLLATDGSKDDVPEEDIGHEWTTDRNAKYDGREGYRAGVRLQMTPGERGCAMSHVCAWRRVAAMGDIKSPVLILEDDAVFRDNFDKCLERTLELLPDDSEPDVLYLGYIQGSTWRRKVAMGIFEAEYLWTTVGYLLWPRGASKLLKAMPVDCPVDNFMAWQIATKALRAFAVDPPLIDQEEEWDCNSDVRHSDDAALGV